MKLMKGLSDGAVLQRNADDECMLYFEAEAKGELKSSLGHLEKCLSGYVLSGIKTGGPYSINLSDDEEELSLSVFVGDLWVAAGQSNMEGAGIFTDEAKKEASETSKYIREYYFEKVWDRATPVAHTKKRESVPSRGVGPAYYFAKKMYDITGVPKGIIPCALGGSTLGQWKPGEGELYIDMLKRVSEVGSRVRGLLWYQGESEAMTPGRSEPYADETRVLIKAFRSDLGNPVLPIVMTQIAATTLPNYLENEGGNTGWNTVREAERLIAAEDDRLALIAAIDATYDDAIHLSTDSQRVMGVRNALAMAALCDEEGGAMPPALESISYEGTEEYPVIRLTFSGTNGLKAGCAPMGFTISPYDTFRFIAPNVGIVNVKLCGNAVLITTSYRMEDLKGKYLYHVYGATSTSNTVTEEGFALPAFGPILLK